MPTLNPRINVTLSPSLDQLVQRMAVHQRLSKSQVLRELLEAAEPALQRAVALMDAASRATAEVKVGLAAHMDRAQDATEDALAVVLSRLDRGRDLVEQAEGVQGRRPARKGHARATVSAPLLSRKVAKNPPPSNRGVKSGKTGGPAKAAPARKGVKS